MEEPAILPLSFPASSLLPGPIKPEESVPCESAFDHDEWHFGIDWEGSRVVLFSTGDGHVWLHDEKLTDVTARFPELVGSAETLPRKPMVLDGVVTVLDSEGRPDLAALGERIARGVTAREQLPAVFLASDLLYIDGVSTVKWSFNRRSALLRELVTPSATLQAPDYIRGKGVMLAHAARTRELGALLARYGKSTYARGVASPHRLHIALETTGNYVVVGAVASSDGWQDYRLSLAEYRDSTLMSVGVIRATLSPAVTQWVQASATHGNLQWARSGLVATVSHDGQTEDGMLIEPSLIALRDDIDPHSCIPLSPIAPPRAMGHRGVFHPTVLEQLPFLDGVGIGRKV